MADQASLLLEKKNVSLNQTHMFGSCSQVQNWRGREGCDLICNPSKLSITSYFNNMKPAKHIHLVYFVRCGLNLTHFVINQMSDSCEEYFPVVRHKEDMTIDKENIDANANLLLELQ
jgi:hypothetical protein